jgi:negative regulator of sigma E activity
MSLPNTNRETLLSAALDGELSVQEQLEFDRELASDPSFAREFAELQSLRLELKASLSPLREQRPSQDFASRVVAAAFEQAAPSAATMPLRPATTNADSVPRGSWRRVATACALAASVLIALGIWNRDRVSELFSKPSQNSLAQLNIDPLMPKAETLKADINTGLVSPAETPEMLASGKPEANALVENEPPKVMGIKPLPDADATTIAPEELVKPTMPAPESIASVDPLVTPPVPSSEKPATSGNREPLQLILVLAVEMTDEGRDQMAVQEALRATDIRLGADSIVGSQVVSHLRDTDVVKTDTNGKQAKIYFIEASAKQIDRFITRLMTSPQAVASVGMSLAMEPPLLAAIGDLREIDPTKIRQDAPAGFARDIRVNGDQAVSFDSKAFAPMDRDIAISDLLQTQEPVGDAPASGDDTPAQLLLIVK